jgi:hypothetical protein
LATEQNDADTLDNLDSNIEALKSWFKNYEEKPPRAWSVRLAVSG